MQYQALALADHDVDVDVVALKGSEPLRALREHPRVLLHLLAAPEGLARRSIPAFIAGSMARAVVQGVQLMRLLWLGVERPDTVLVQNPPAVPILMVAMLYARVRSTRLVIDWHNFGHTMLALRLGPEHPAVRLMRWCERVFGRRADAHLCVSRAMAEALERNLGVSRATVLYDRPAQAFHPVGAEDRPALLARLDLGSPLGSGKRPAILVSPSSWTADEDPGMLLEAAIRCDEMTDHGADASFPDLLILLTGRGPLRALYERRINRLSLRRIHLRTLWLSAEDYALTLGVADLGVCCHRSSSGLDLPMKIADMFGASLPVCAYDYGPCLREIMRDGENGLLFSDAEQLANQLYKLLRGFPHDTPLLDKLRGNLARNRPTSWSAGWNEHAAGVLLPEISRTRQ
jgi:beta-1,4-mannosyltransferase